MAIRVPGIIVRIVNDTGIVAPPIYERYPVMIGEGDPFRLITNQEIEKGVPSGTDTILTTQTVNDIVSVGDLPGIANYAAGVDYSLSGNAITWLGASEPDTGDSYYVTFTETRPASAYTPMLYFDQNLVIADHGNKTRTNGNINDVVVGADLAFNNGAKGVIVAQIDLSGAVDPDSPTDIELENAFIATKEQLRGITDYKLFLVPMSSGTLVTTTANDIFFNHAVLSSQPDRKQERTCIGCMPKGTDLATFGSTAQAYANERMVLPAVADGTVNVTGFTTDYDMRFYNAALAGKVCSVDIGINISDEIIFGITFVSNFLYDEQNWLVGRGVSPAKIRGTVVRNVMAITTDTTNALTEDLGVQDVKDYTKKYWREGLWNLYRNAPITPTLIGRITNSSESIFKNLIGRNIVAEKKNLSVAQDITEPRKINAAASVKSAFGLQWMDITFTFVLSF
jgi:hypothetical protein